MKEIPFRDQFDVLSTICQKINSIEQIKNGEQTENFLVIPYIEPKLFVIKAMLQKRQKILTADNNRRIVYLLVIRKKFILSILTHIYQFNEKIYRTVIIEFFLNSFDHVLIFHKTNRCALLIFQPRERLLMKSER